jgi:hypothetical protein
MRGTCQQLFRFASVVLCLILAACSGGGGGGGDSNNGSSGLSLSTNVITFTAPNTNSTPPSQIITATVTGVTSGTLYIKIVSTGPAVASITNIIITSTTTGQGTINPAPANILGPGVHTSTVTVYACTTDPNCSSGQLAGSPQTVNVTYTITGVAASTSSLNYSIGDSPVAGDFTRQFNVTGYPNQNWNAASNVPWLSVLPVSGNAGNATQITASLVQAQIDGMFNGAYSGTVTITPTSGITVTIPVTLVISRTQVNHVSPYVAVSGVSDEVIIRGENFNQVSIQNIKFGGNNATAFNVTSDTEIRATHPALSAGNYLVQLQNNVGVNRSLANLVVVDAPNFAERVLPYSPFPPGGPVWRRVIDLKYDAERKALLVGLTYSTGIVNNQLFRYVYTTDWNGPTIINTPNLSAFALSTDGQQLLVGSESKITQYNPSTLVSGTATDWGNYYFKGFGITNDGYAIALTSAYGSGYSPALRYSIRNPGFISLTSPIFYWGNIGGSADGSRVLMGSTFNSGNVYQYNASTGLLSATSMFLNTYNIDLNRTGSRILMNKQSIYNENFGYLGSLPTSTLSSVLSPSGARAYSYDSNGTLRVFDLTATPVGGFFPEIGTGTVLPSDPGPGVNGTDMKMAISPDGGTLFLAGSSVVIVQPAP